MTIDRLSAIRELTAPGEAFEVVEGEVWGRPCRMFLNAPLTLRDLYETARSDATFLVYGEEQSLEPGARSRCFSKSATIPHLPAPHKLLANPVHGA